MPTHLARTTAAPALLAFALLAATLLGTAGCGTAGKDVAPVEVRVMTYNIHYGDPDLGRMADVICSSGADVVGLQEVDVHWGDRSGFADQAAELAAACGMEYRYGPIYSLPPLEEGGLPREFGVAILTRLPVLSWENHPLTRLSTQSESGPEPMPGFLHVAVALDGARVDVFVTHLDFRPDPSVRQAQVAEMLALMGPMDGPTVLLGDMNATPDRAELAPLFHRMRDAWGAAPGPGFTFPGDAPDRRIDYILVGGPVDVVAVEVPDTDASDHRPVVADLVLRTP